MRIQKNNLTVKTIVVMIVIALSKVVGFVRTAVLAAVFGATWETDAYYMAHNIISIIANASSQGLTSAVVPIRTEEMLQGGQKKADRYTSALINIVLMITTALAAAAYFAMPYVVRIFAPEFTGDKLTLTISIVRVTLILVVVMAMVNVLAGLLNSHHRYLPAQMLGFPLSVVTVAFALLLGRSWGINAMVAGLVIGTILQLGVLLPSLRGVFRYTPSLDFASPAIKKTLALSLPVFISTYADIINQAVDKALASGLVDGSISAITYAHQLVQLVTGIVVVPIATTLFTSLSELAAAKRLDRMKALVSRVGCVLIVILLPITALSLLFAPEIVDIVYRRGSFTAEAAGLTSAAFFFYAASFAAIGLRLALTRCFLALKDSKTSLIITIAGVALNIALNIALVGPMRVAGLALATTISFFVMCILQLVFLRRRIGRLGIGFWVRDGAKALLACAAMTPVAWFIKQNLHSPILSFGCACLAGGALYVLALWLMGQRDLREAVGKLRAFAAKGAGK